MKYVIDCSTVFPMYVAEPLTSKATALRDVWVKPNQLWIEYSNFVRQPE